MILLKELAFRNLKAYKSRTISMFFFAFLMSLSLFAGTVVVQGIKSGLKTIESRLGADILVVPEEAKTDFDAQSVLINGNPGYFYMSADKYQEILKIPGIEKAAPQLFLASASAGCCSAPLQLIGFNPENDFTIQPWIKDTDKNLKLELFDIIVGSNIKIDEEGYIRLYGQKCRIRGQFAPTGSTLDNAVYMNYETVKKLTAFSLNRKLNKYDDFDIESVISSVLIKVKDGYDVEEVAGEIQKKIQGIQTATSKSMVSGIGRTLQSVSRTTNIFVLSFWGLSFFMILLIFLIMINERRKEFASLMVFGADRKIIRNLIIKEALSVNLGGALAAILLSLMILISFRTAISQAIGGGFIIPQIYKMGILTAAVIFSVLASSMISSFIAIKKIKGLDPSFTLREGD